MKERSPETNTAERSARIRTETIELGNMKFICDLDRCLVEWRQKTNKVD